MFEKLKLYSNKAWGLAFNPRRLIKALRTVIKQRNQAVGIKTFRATSSPPPSVALKREPVAPFETAESTMVSIIIPTKIRHDLLKDCLASLRHIKRVSHETIIVDNGATHPDMIALLEEAANIPNTKIVRHDIPFNFSKLCNLGAERARAPNLLFLNDDIEALDGTWLAEMCSFLARPDVGVVGARLLYPSRDLQHAGIATNLLPGPGHPWRHSGEKIWATHPVLSMAGEVDAVTGACLLIKKEVFERVSGFDELNFPITQNDVDLCLKVRRLGLRVVYTPTATLLHKESQSRPHDDRRDQQVRQETERRALFERHSDFCRFSVFYPTHLRRDTENADLAS
ncbi:glycosyltransferase family 2 protein [Asticcacaulis excentricus]|nr:glycosyltransferase family 2 protein [Asticcacaulis excentricus]